MKSSEQKPAKKKVKGRKPVVRSVLCNPFSVEWPAVSRADTAAVLAAVTANVAQFDIVTSLPQAEYRRLLEAGDRAAITAARHALRQKAAPLLESRRRHLQHCVLGFNAASRALEQGRLAALLVEAETPALQTRMLAPLARGRRCPAVCIHRLRQTLQARCGVSAAVLGLTSEVTHAQHHLYPLYLAVCAAAPPLGPAVPAAVTTAAATARETRSERTSEAAESEDEPPPPRAVSPVPFDQADFIAFSSTPAPKRRPPPSRRVVSDQLDSLMSIDTVGVPNERRALLKAAQVMQVTAGDKAERRAAKLAHRKAAKLRRAQAKTGSKASAQ